MEDVKEILFNQTMASYTKEKQLVAYIKQLEEQLKEVREVKDPEIID